MVIISKTTTMLTSRLTNSGKSNIETYQYESPLRTASHEKHPGITLSSDLRWTHHNNDILSRATRLLGVLKRLSSLISQGALLCFYRLYVQPILEYTGIAWSGLPQYQADRLEHFSAKGSKIYSEDVNVLTHKPFSAAVIPRTIHFEQSTIVPSFCPHFQY